MAVTDRDAAPRYGKALFEVAQEQGHLPAVRDELAQVNAVINATPELMPALASKNLTKAAKDQLVALLTQDASELVAHLVNILLANGRILGLSAVIDDFDARFNAATQHVEATVTTAVPLTEAQVQAMNQALAKQFNVKTVGVTAVVDPAVIGGVKVQSNDLIIDGTVKTRLAQLRQQLLTN
ncbi:ATP synthase F1 subunit delta [Lacticaseibacillus jixianensis]|uniref:ATP synthase subunit delta n=1 Tax=Lacticaseibacillus jixianensis TaxID=2486012 RepID=A0ABW4BBV7_9LACO|nr:ATP synthase F1 subunit delta [Lacticaseibacillus jixianensis]